MWIINSIQLQLLIVILCIHCIQKCIKTVISPGLVTRDPGVLHPVQPVKWLSLGYFMVLSSIFYYVGSILCSTNALCCCLNVTASLQFIRKWHIQDNFSSVLFKTFSPEKYPATTCQCCVSFLVHLLPN